MGFDVTIANPTCPTHVHEAARRAGATIAKAEEMKHKKYPKHLYQAESIMVPLAMECYGRISTQFAHFLSHAGLIASTDSSFRHLGNPKAVKASARALLGSTTIAATGTQQCRDDPVPSGPSFSCHVGGPAACKRWSCWTLLQVRSPEL